MNFKLLDWLRAIWTLRHPESLMELRRLITERRAIEGIRSCYPHARIDRDACFKGWSASRLHIGNAVAIERGTLLVWDEFDNGSGSISIGDGTWIGEFNNLRLGGQSSIRIGRNCLISQHCSLIAANHGTQLGSAIKDQPLDPKKINVFLGDDVWLGAGTCVLPSVQIGDGAIVAAGSVVVCDIAPFEIWGGVPARKLKTRQHETKAEID